MEEELIQGMWWNEEDKNIFLWADGYAYFWVSRKNGEWSFSEWFSNGFLKAGGLKDSFRLDEHRLLIKEELVSW